MSQISHSPMIDAFTGNKQRYRDLIKRHCKSIFPFDTPHISSKYNDYSFVQKLSDRIEEGIYNPTPPRGILTLPKTNDIPRFIPCFSLADCLAYFYCVESLREIIGLGRSEHTFGGWSTSNPIRQIEETEFKEYDKQNLYDNSPYGSSTSLDPVQFRRIWRDFQRRAFILSRKEDIEFFAYIDIANFYDCINIDILEKEIRSSSEYRHKPFIDLLFHFLSSWGQDFTSYSKRHTGLPLDEIGDSSRILSNLYLRPYDRDMSLYANSHGSLHYLRFADDQILMADSERSLNLFIRYAAERLSKIGLSINASKVLKFNSRESYDNHWCFNLFSTMMRNPDEAAVAYFSGLDSGEIAPSSRHRSVLNALSWQIDRLSAGNQRKIVESSLSRSYIESCELQRLIRVIRFYEPNDWEIFNDIIQDIFFDVRFNYSPLQIYNLYQQSTQETPAFITEYIQNQGYVFKWTPVPV